MAGIGFLGFEGLARKRTVRAAINPIDKSTIVSIFHKPLDETKSTITPRFYHIDAGSYEDPAILVVGPASWWREVDEESPLLEITNSSIQVADSIVKDYCNGIFGCNMVDAMPGIFYIPGAFSKEEIRLAHRPLLDKARDNQKRWYETLVKLADGLWSKSNGNPIVIGEDMRHAAKALNLLDKDWMKDFTMLQNVNCIACGSPRNPNFPICPVCKAIADPEKAKAMNIKFAD